MLDDNLIRLDDIARDIFGLSLMVARRRAADGLLPIPAFRLSGSRKGVLFVTRESLEKYKQGKIADAIKLHKAMSLV